MEEIAHLERFFNQSGPIGVFVIGLLWVIYRVLNLWISKHYEHMVPLYERQIVAIEKLAATADRVAENLSQEHRLTSASLRALWHELEARRPAGGTHR